MDDKSVSMVNSVFIMDMNGYLVINARIIWMIHMDMVVKLTYVVNNLRQTCLQLNFDRKDLQSALEWKCEKMSL